RSLPGLRPVESADGGAGPGGRALGAGEVALLALAGVVETAGADADPAVQAAELLHADAGGVPFGAGLVQLLTEPIHLGAEALDEDADAVGAGAARVGEDGLDVGIGLHVAGQLFSHRCGLRPARRPCGG